MRNKITFFIFILIGAYAIITSSTAQPLSSCEEGLPCDDGNPCTANDMETILISDGSICIPCAGID